MGRVGRGPRSLPSRPKLLQKNSLQRKCFEAIHFVKISQESLYKANSLACFVAKRDTPVAATLQRKSSGGIIFVTITKISITKENIPRNYFVIISARMVCWKVYVLFQSPMEALQEHPPKGHLRTKLLDAIRTRSAMTRRDISMISGIISAGCPNLFQWLCSFPRATSSGLFLAKPCKIPFSFQTMKPDACLGPKSRWCTLLFHKGKRVFKYTLHYATLRQITVTYGKVQ